MQDQNSNRVPYIVSLGLGLLICFVISLLTGKREAWDTVVYFSLGIPLMALIIFVLAYFYPFKPWRWTLAMTLGQSIAIVLNSGGSLSLWPLSIAAILIYSLPQFFTGFLGAKLSKRNR